jgi:hypothetical protein
MAPASVRAAALLSGVGPSVVGSSFLLGHRQVLAADEGKQVQMSGG